MLQVGSTLCWVAVGVLMVIVIAPLPFMFRKIKDKD